jgi:hypothetical protein
LALYLGACDALVREGNLQRMLETGRRLVKAAPDLAIAHALYGIAEAHVANDTDRTPEEVAALQRAARDSAARALALDPNTPKAYIAIANSYPDGGHFIEREQALANTRRIDPNLNPGKPSYIAVLSEVGRLKEATEFGREVTESADPRTGGGTPEPSFVVLTAESGDMAGAERMLAQLDQIAPAQARIVRWQVVSLMGDPATGPEQVRAIGPEDINPRSYACVQQFLGELRQRIASHARGLPQACDAAPPSRRMVLLSREGDVDGAYAEVERTIGSPQNFIENLYGPGMKAFRADPRFMRLAKRLGLVDYWEKSGHWPDFCAEPGLPYDCRVAARAPEGKGKV